MTKDVIRHIDLHMHSTVSDGTDTPAEIIGKVRDAGIDLFSLTDHDAVKGSKEIMAHRKEGDPHFIPGAEFSARDTLGKYHILGYGFDVDHPALQTLIGRVHALRMEKVQGRLDYLKEEYGYTFREEDLAHLFAQENPGRPHIAMLMVEYGYVKTKSEGFRILGKKQFPKRQVGPEEVIPVIVEAGGIPVLAHPSYGDGDDMIIGSEMEERVKRLVAMGLAGLEAYYSGFSKKLTEELLGYAERFHLFVTAGSDYHGTNKLVRLGDTGLSDVHEAHEALRHFLTVIGEDRFL